MNVPHLPDFQTAKPEKNMIDRSLQYAAGLGSIWRVRVIPVNESRYSVLEISILFEHRGTQSNMAETWFHYTVGNWGL